MRRSSSELSEDARVNAGSTQDPAPERALDALADDVLSGEIEPLDGRPGAERIAQEPLQSFPVVAQIDAAVTSRRC